MALFAKDNEETISAWDALPGKRYNCLDCQTPLLLRKSKYRFPHFYHISAQRTCRLYGKSQKHLLIQLAIQQKIPGTVLEKPFPSIQRIADVAWQEKQIIFEIQCSKISKQEAESRVNEYRSLGHEVVWILSDSLFNRKKASQAENWMRQNMCYYVDRDLNFYDQQESIENLKRTYRGKKIPIQFSPKKLDFWPEFQSQQLKNRILNKYYFENDLLHLAIENRIQERIAHKTIPIKYFLRKYLIEPYTNFLNTILRKL